MTLQLSHIFLPEALTFISLPPSQGNRRSLVAVRYPPSVQVVRRKLHEHPVARQYAYEILAHLARDVRQNLVLAVVQPHPKHGVWQSLDDLRHTFYRFFFRHAPRVSIAQKLTRLANCE